MNPFHIAILIGLSTPLATNRLIAQVSAPDPLQPLSVLIGSWDVEDIYRSVSGAEFRETGVRTCVFTLMNRYVECVTHARNAAGRQREYRWFFTHNAETGRHELTSIFSNTSLKLHQTIRIDSTNHVWYIRSPSSFDDGVEQWSGAQLRFESADRAVWTAYRNLDTLSVTEWEQSAREVWMRRRSP